MAKKRRITKKPPRDREFIQMYEDKFYLDKFKMHQCCHCALVHNTEFLVEKGRIFTRWKVNRRATLKARKAAGIKVIKTHGT